MFCTVTGMVALRPDSFMSDFSTSRTPPVSSSRYSCVDARYSAAASWSPRQEVESERRMALLKGVLTRSGWDRIFWKPSRVFRVARISSKASVLSSRLRSEDG